MRVRVPEGSDFAAKSGADPIAEILKKCKTIAVVGSGLIVCWWFFLAWKPLIYFSDYHQHDAANQYRTPQHDPYR